MGQCMIKCIFGDATSCCSRCIMPCLPDKDVLTSKDIVKGRDDTNKFLRGCVWEAKHFNGIVVEDIVIHDHIKCRIYRHSNNNDINDTAMLYIHGGGFVFGSIDGYHNYCCALIKATGCNTLISIEYTKAPEAVFPTALLECYNVLMWMNTNGRAKYKYKRLGLIGDSAGANLCAALCRLSRNILLNLEQEGEFMKNPLEFPPSLRNAYIHDLPFVRIDFQILIVPVTDFEATHRINDECWKSSYLIKRKSLNAMLNAYIGDDQKNLCNLTHLIGTNDHVNLPSTLIVLAECDSLRVQGAKYAQLLKQSNVNVHVYNFPKMHHSFGVMVDYLPNVSQQLMKVINNFLTNKSNVVKPVHIEKKNEKTPLLQT